MTKRTGVRFNLDEPKDKAVYEYIQSLDKSRYKSINSFIIEAMYQYIQSMAKIAEDKSIKALIRETIKDELRTIFGSMFVGQPMQITAESKQIQPEYTPNTPEEDKAALAFVNSMV